MQYNEHVYDWLASLYRADLAVERAKRLIDNAVRKLNRKRK